MCAKAMVLASKTQVCDQHIPQVMKVKVHDHGGAIILYFETGNSRLHQDEGWGESQGSHDMFTLEDNTWRVS